MSHRAGLSTLEELSETLHLPLPPDELCALYTIHPPFERQRLMDSYGTARSKIASYLLILNEISTSMQSEGLHLAEEERTAQLWHASVSNSLCPVLSLPTELLQGIFKCTIFDTFEAAPRIALSHVCRQWRIASLDMRSMWAPVTVIFPKHAEMFMSFADRSAPRLMDVEIMIHDDYHSLAEANETIHARADRVAELTMFFHQFDGIRQPHLDFSVADLPNLRFVSLNVPEYNPWTGYRKYISLDILPSSLPTLVIRAHGVELRQHDKFTHLTNLKLTHVTLEDVHALLSSMFSPTLEVLEMFYIDPSYFVPQNVEMPSQMLSNLRHMSIILAPIELFEMIAFHLPTPRLQHLDICIHSLSPYRIDEAFVDSPRFIRAFEQMFQNMAELRSLGVAYAGEATTYLLEPLAIPNRLPIAPCLTDLSLTFHPRFMEYNWARRQNLPVLRTLGKILQARDQDARYPSMKQVAIILKNGMPEIATEKVSKWVDSQHIDPNVIHVRRMAEADTDGDGEDHTGETDDDWEEELEDYVRREANEEQREFERIADELTMLQQIEAEQAGLQGPLD